MHTLHVSVAVFAIGTAIAGPSFAQSQQPKDPATTTRTANDPNRQDLPFSDRSDFDDVRRGFVATVPNLEIKAEDGRTVWTLKGYEFLSAQSPPGGTVNPSLWRQAQLNLNNGLFKVTDRIFQVRGFDLSNVTIVEGDTGLIVVDPLTARETAKAAMDLYFQHRPRKPVVAVIYTHSHADHFGGVKGVVNEEDVKSGKVKIVAPDGFLEHAVSENVFAGNAMSRRSIYMYGPLLGRGERGQVDAGLGKTVLRPARRRSHESGTSRAGIDRSLGTSAAASRDCLCHNGGSSSVWSGSAARRAMRMQPGAAPGSGHSCRS